MTTVRLYEQPFAPAAAQVFEVASIGEWLLERYGAVPSVTVQVFTGAPSADTEVTRDLAALLRSDAPEYVVLESPGDPFSAFQVFQIVVAVYSVASVLLASKPSLPSNVNRTQSSPNNSLTSRDNQVRYLQRVEDIYGEVRSVPSLMMPTYNKYINNRQFEYGYYCVGRGYYDIENVKDGDTLIADFAGAKASFYKPFESPNTDVVPFLQIGEPIADKILTVSRSVEVNGITLKPLNQVLIGGGNFSFNPVAPDMTRIRQMQKRPNFNAAVNPGDTIYIKIDTMEGEQDFEGYREVISVGDGELYVESIGVLLTDVSAIIRLEGATNLTDWVALTDPDRTQIWINLIAQNGLYRDAGEGKSSTSTTIRIDYEKLDSSFNPTGITERVDATLSGATSDERAITVEHTTAWTGPTRVQLFRITPYDYDFEGTIIDEVKWADLYSVSPVTKNEFGNKTTVHTVTAATARATSARSRQLNCLASRLLPTYDGSSFSGSFDADGRLVSGTISATSRVVDILAAVSIDPKIGRRNLATDVDIAQVWGVQQQLDAWNEKCGQFNYTLDTDNLSYEETVNLIANAAFCIAYRQNGRIRFALDRAQPNSTAVFTHRNKALRSETITRKFASDSEFDGVEFVYSDPDTEQSETILLPLDGSAVNPKKFEIAGIRSFTQAWLRANREYYKIMGQRVTIETSTTNDARALLPNSRVDIVDNTRFKSYDGEVVAQNGMVLTLSRAVAFTPGQPHSLVLMKRDGSLQTAPVTAGVEPRQVVMSSLPAEAIVTVETPEGGVRTIFSFAADDARAAQAYLVQEIDLSDSSYPVVRAVNYSASYYQADYATIPDKETIIN